MKPSQKNSVPKVQSIGGRAGQKLIEAAGQHTSTLNEDHHLYFQIIERIFTISLIYQSETCRTNMISNCIFWEICIDEAMVGPVPLIIFIIFEYLSLFILPKAGLLVWSWKITFMEL